MATERWTRRLEIGAYVAIIVMALLTASILLPKWTGKYFSRATARQPYIKVGDQIVVPNQDWSKNGKTLVMVLSTNCHFCSESAPFYRKLLAETSADKNLHVAALFPQSREEGQAYLSNLGVPLTDVQQVTKESLQVQATPTLILVDQRGAVLDSWTGKIQASEEPTVTSKITSRGQAK